MILSRAKAQSRKEEQQENEFCNSRTYAKTSQTLISLCPLRPLRFVFRNLCVSPKYF